MATTSATAITKHEPAMPAVAVGGELSVEMMVARKRKIHAVMKQVMQMGVHYGLIPGCGPKPTLHKSGAEVLCTTFGLAPFFAVDRIDHDNGHREYFVTCTIKHIASGAVLGEGLGSCSTLEKKYRYRGGGRVENPDIADQYNTVLKMALKRALVGVTLTSVGASDLLTQDIEDLGGGDDDGGVIDADFRELAKPPDNLKLAILGARNVAELEALFVWIDELDKAHQPVARADYDAAMAKLKAPAMPAGARAREQTSANVNTSGSPPPSAAAATISAPPPAAKPASAPKAPADASIVAGLRAELLATDTEVAVNAVAAKIAGYEMGKATRDELLTVYQQHKAQIRDAAKALREASAQTELPTGGAA